MKYTVDELESLCRCDCFINYNHNGLILNFVKTGWVSTDEIYMIDIEDNIIEITIVAKEVKQ